MNPYLNKPIYIQLPVPEKYQDWICDLVKLGRRLRFYTDFTEFAKYATMRKRVMQDDSCSVG